MLLKQVFDAPGNLSFYPLFRCPGVLSYPGHAQYDQSIHMLGFCWRCVCGYNRN